MKKSNILLFFCELLCLCLLANILVEVTVRDHSVVMTTILQVVVMLLVIGILLTMGMRLDQSAMFKRNIILMSILIIFLSIRWKGLVVGPQSHAIS